MKDNLIHYEGGEVLATDEPLTVESLLIPFNEVGRTNIGRFQVAAGDIRLPSVASTVAHNLDHTPQEVVGSGSSYVERAEGVFARIKFDDTDEGRAAYADAISPTGKRRKVSAEFGPVIIKAGRIANPGVPKLWGHASVEAGAFPSAQVLAADTPDEAVPPAPEDTDNGEHLALEAQALPEDITVTTTAGDSAVYTPEAAPAADNPEGEVIVTATAPGAPAPAIPQTVLASAPQTPAPATTQPREVELQQIYAAFAAVKSNPYDSDARQVLAALTDIKFDGSGALPTTGVLRPNWVGKIEQGIPYVREYIGLGNLGTDISAGGKSGFVSSRGTSGAPIAGPANVPNGGNWAGNKTEINSYGGFTDVKSSFFRRFAEGNDIGREFFDLPGGAPAIEDFLTNLVEDHAYWSDMWALYDINTAAGAPVAPKTYPTDYPAALGQLLQGILAVKARKSNGRRDVPTFAIANEEAYEALVYAAGGEQHLPAFVSIAVSTNSEGTVDGSVQVVQGDTGITGSASVVVGAKRAIEFDELAGGPLHIDALELSKGGVDRAVHGYLQTFHVRPEGVVRIGTPETRANSTAYPLGRLIKASTVVYRVIGNTASGFAGTIAGGTTGGSAPTAPSVGDTVNDGTAVLLRLA